LAKAKPPSKTKALHGAGNGTQPAKTNGVSPTSAGTTETGTTEPAVRSAGTLGEARQMIQLRMGQLFLAVARLPRYRDVRTRDLMADLLEPLQRGQIAFAEQGEGAGTLVGMAIWARVSDTVSDAITAQIEAKTFPVQLSANDWTSGETIWLLDLIVPSRKAGTAVFTNFTKVIGERPFRLHPIVAASLDADIVAQINALAAGSATLLKPPEGSNGS
jgi:cytolysin-activating lysine-acyltransferase